MHALLTTLMVNKVGSAAAAHMAGLATEMAMRCVSAPAGVGCLNAGVCSSGAGCPGCAGCLGGGGCSDGVACSVSASCSHDGGCLGAGLSSPSSRDATSQMLSALARDPPLAWHPGGHVERSRLLPGVLLRMPLRSPSMLALLPARGCATRFVVLMCDVFAADGMGTSGNGGSSSGGINAATATLELRSGSAFTAARHAHMECVRRRLSALASRGAHVVVSTVRVGRRSRRL